MSMNERTLEVHAAHCTIAQHEIQELMVRQHREGMDWRAISAALGAAQAQLILDNVGIHNVGPHFRIIANLWDETAKKQPPEPVRKG